MTEQTPNPSTLLKDTREAKGLTLDIVHEATKIPLDALKAIEQGYSVRILTPFYYRGFIKIYAEFLGLEAQETLKFYNMGMSAAPVPAGKPPAGATKQPRIRQQPNPALEQMQEFLNRMWAPKNRKWLLRMGGFILVLFVLVKFVGCVATHIKNKPKAKSVPIVLKIKGEKPLARVPAQESSTATAVISQTIKAQSADHKVELAVRAAKDSWIQVKTDGKVTFAMTMQKGTMESWSAHEQIELSGKNINELDLEVNGKHIGSLGSAERRAKRVVITKDGLTVKK